MLSRRNRDDASVQASIPQNAAGAVRKYSNPAFEPPNAGPSAAIDYRDKMAGSLQPHYASVDSQAAEGYKFVAKPSVRLDGPSGDTHDRLNRQNSMC